MTTHLDNPALRTSLDTQNMLVRVEEFPQQCRHAEELARNFALPKLPKIENIVLCGMGGSAIGGDLLRAYAQKSLAMPFEVVRNYSLPAYVGKNSCVIAVSYSGNTEETLSALKEAKIKSAFIVSVTSGGTLENVCREEGIPCLKIPGGFAPRAALGYGFIPLLVFFERWGFLGDQKGELNQLNEILVKLVGEYGSEVLETDNIAKQLALKLYKTIPVIYTGQDVFEPVATRWRAQFNENSKTFAHNSVLPEMNHNEILGWDYPSEVLESFQPIYLLDGGYHKQIQKRFSVMKSILSLSKEIIEIQSQGSGVLARMFSLILLGDFTSVYLAYLNGINPTAIPAIDRMKQELKKG